MKVMQYNDNDGKIKGHMIFCPACKNGHGFDIHRWQFNGDFEKPTFTPSMLVTSSKPENPNFYICHSFVTDGKIRFLDDCTHDLKGKTLELEHFER